MPEKLYTTRSEMFANPLVRGAYFSKSNRGVVWMPSAFTEKKIYPFRPLQLRFLHAFAAGEPLPAICDKLGITDKQAATLLKRSKCKEYLAELEMMEADVVARSAKTRVAREMLDVWDGKSKKDREQMEAGKELWARVWPKPGIGHSASGERIEININIGKLEEAFNRQSALEAEVITERKSA